ncbi:hypothetical protein HBI81_100850 [Parastagonospora nodorum]|nr:hypothetical protein HBH51_068500 [Parastagonospora nodorum]KAH4066916.1 hypothetical protein HBH50_144750 [Parastagonospora nodorum]KAH4086021.1 hypothetical protein HBH48_145120 [Parastagonospora nodorum]KAH4119888.1 hypothetical protein HBH47_116550 [Parastagonospora nodorum]KAH4208681.1 hypothetical protein HBI95_093850 [Parastagonospora nodorum]
MRYDFWDVILFPKDSPVPIQEFKTACYHASDTRLHQPPTLACYISSLPPTTPFRISIHSWAPAAKPSAVIESRRKAHQKIMYMIQVIVDGARVFRGCFDIPSKWPQEIAHEKRAHTSTDHPTSQHKTPLGFPPFAQQTLMQPTWESRDPRGRINIVLSEQLISTGGSLGESDLESSNEIVCFSFQHAPKDVLEQAGISWPIRNPLYLSGVHSDHASPNSTVPSPKLARTQGMSNADKINSPHKPASMSMSSFMRSRNSEPFQRPRTQPPAHSHFPKPPLGARGHSRADIWDDSFGSFRDNHDSISLDSWSTHRSTSNSTGDALLGDGIFGPSHASRPPAWRNPPLKFQASAKPNWAGQRSRKDRDKQVVLTLRDDQLGQIIQAISPPKRHQDLAQGPETQSGGYSGRPPAPHMYCPPKMGSLSLTGPPSAAALARKSSYSNLNAALRNAQNRPSPGKPVVTHHSKTHATAMYHPSASSNKENFPPSQSRLPTAFPAANRVPTPDIFAPSLAQWDSDVSMRNPSSLFSGYNQAGSRIPVLSEIHNKHSPAHTPSNLGGIKSRKEGLTRDSPHLSEQGARHDQSLLPQTTSNQSTIERPMGREHLSISRNTPRRRSKAIPDIVEIIDVDAIDPDLNAEAPIDATKLSPYQAQHKPGMSSMDSTTRIERETRDALGVYLDAHSDIDMGPELAHALRESTVVEGLGTSPRLNTGTSGFEHAAKRKREVTQETESPVSKREKGGNPDVEEVADVDMPGKREE